jgi:small subunit ribosomal protein S2
MAETTAEAGASAPGASPHPIHSDVTVRELLEAGVHFGHQTQRWNPRMKPFLFGERNGVHIIDLDQTLPRMRDALDFVREISGAGGKILFVATKRQAAAPIQFEAQRAGQFYVNNRWLGGMLTNFKTVKKSIERFKGLLEIVGDEAKVAEYPKKELSRIHRLIEKYKKSLDGIREMTRLPDAIFVIDVAKEEIAVTEARRLGIPIVAIVDSNCSPEGIDFVVPGNDDSIRAIQLYCSRVADACLEGAALNEERIRAEVAEAEQARASGEGAARPTGRVVVEITQPPRRGRAASFGRDPDREVPEPAVVAAPPTDEA